MPIASSIYNAVFRRNYVFIGTVFVSAFAFEMVFDTVSDRVWDNLNKGRQWKDIRHRYVTAEDEE
ncbi:cytochrome b-c1 complex subunit 9 [Geopyxis carbonaria]|nr:cytochrome b-c1 complex subunit 9 [Geopyxis carbonaria]